MSKDKTLYEFAEEFRLELEELDLADAALYLDFHGNYEDPILDITAELGDRTYLNSYSLEEIDSENLNSQELYEALVETFEDNFDSVEV